MILLNIQQYPPPAKARLIAFTTPENYAGKLSRLIQVKGWTPLWCPTIAVESTASTVGALRRYVQPPDPILREFAAVAFTSRTGITAFAEAIHSSGGSPPLDPTGEIFTISALGKDAELLDDSFIKSLCENAARIRVLVPAVATPSALAEALGSGEGRRKVLCPVPVVIGLEEPPVVPKFLTDLHRRGWIPVRVDAYETRRSHNGTGKLVEAMAAGAECKVDAIVFTSTAEVEGLLKSLQEIGLDWETIRRTCPGMVAAAQGPVTAAGAEQLGVGIDVVSSRFDSFDGVVDALEYKWQNG
ncbi:hypothetical protein M569_03949 [Genlisea aurea]|uniref:Tetrapyrrole biosynthesis uroporphyrinogen III synthase domain-containing protein n=1 Tax=Genlisea aurea TaxID=192259 RepID=S8CVG8_9LAMI|nr:hypothetical protein M569_03949 [Genlisea aurea]